MRHEFSVLIRMAKRAITQSDKDKYASDRDDDLSSVTRHSFMIKKNKVLILAGSGEFLRTNEHIDKYNIGRGQIDDLQSLLSYAKRYGLLEKVKNNWQFFEHKAKNLADVTDLFKQKPSEKFRLQNAVIELAKRQVISGTGACDAETMHDVQSEEGDTSE